MTEDEFTDEIHAKTLSQYDEFSYLNNLSEKQRIAIMRRWDRPTWIRFCMQNTVSEEEVFDPILRLIEEDEV